MSRGRVLVAMSGGVDSSVAAWLLQREGYECVGATMRLAANEDDRPGERTCCSVDDVADAREACWRLGIRHHVFDYTRQFDRYVIEPFVDAYERGLTPNPCVACNRRLKFGALLERALDLGCDYLATGHYARVEPVGSAREGDGPTGCWRLLKGVDASKDQSYFLHGLTQAQLRHALLPLGGMVKATQVRRIAEEAGLAVAHKKDSEGICFVPGGDHARYIEERTGRAQGEGPILDASGAVLGTHHGTMRYTIGQRKGLGVASDRPRYVCALDAATNTVTLGDAADLMRSSLVAEGWSWVAGTPPCGPGGGLDAAAKVRYHQPDQPCRITPEGDGHVRVDFASPQRAVAPGQYVVAYRGDEVLGGGVIARAGR